jgi:hypothetical protein
MMISSKNSALTPESTRKHRTPGSHLLHSARSTAVAAGTGVENISPMCDEQLHPDSPMIPSTPMVRRVFNSTDLTKPVVKNFTAPALNEAGVYT